MMARLLMWWWAPLAVALAAVIGWETDWGDGVRKPVVLPPSAEARPVASALLPEYKPAAGPEAYAEVVDRPLFSPTRRPAPPPPPPEQPKPQMQTGQYQLTGVIQVGDKLYAFLKEVKSGKGLRAAQGDVLSTGLKLAKVEPDRVVLTQFDGEEEVKMQVAKSTRLTPTAPPPPPPGAPGTPGAAPPGAQVAAPGALPPPGSVPAIGQPVPQQAPPGAARPAAPTMAPFVPGVSTAPRPDGTPESPRRRGAPQ